MVTVLVWNPVVVMTAIVLITTGVLMVGYAFSGVRSDTPAGPSGSNVVLIAAKRPKKSKKNA